MSYLTNDTPSFKKIMNYLCKFVYYAMINVIHSGSPGMNYYKAVKNYPK